MVTNPIPHEMQTALESAIVAPIVIFIFGAVGITLGMRDPFGTAPLILFAAACLFLAVFYSILHVIVFGFAIGRASSLYKSIAAKTNTRKLKIAVALVAALSLVLPFSNESTFPMMIVLVCIFGAYLNFCFFIRRRRQLANELQT